MLAPEQTLVYYVLSGLRHLGFSLVLLLLTLVVVVWMQNQLQAENRKLKENEIDV